MNLSSASILVVDDKPNMLRLLTKVLSPLGRVRTCESGDEAIALLNAQTFDVIVSDLKMPGASGLDVLREAHRLMPHTRFILMTAYSTVGTAIEALRLGAFDYLTKPLDPEDLRLVVRAALAVDRRTEPSKNTEDTEVLPGLYARSAIMKDTAQLVRRVADSSISALIIGETGTGKELVARALHALSPRADERFVALNCAAIPGGLLESELFGHKKGTFTGAARDRQGLFEDADQGTLFLDEIGEMRVSMQAKLTRALEERAVRRLGESVERSFDTRVVAATNRDLEAMVEDGTFREDLWYRLNGAIIPVPALRDRREDVQLLAEGFLDEIARSSVDSKRYAFSDEAIDRLMSYDWPGNVRQLKACVHRAFVVAEGPVIHVSDLALEVRGKPPVSDSTMELHSLPWKPAMQRGKQALAQSYLKAVLQRFDGDVVEAANHAGVERESFYRLLRRYDVSPDAFR